jgi:hypothetical protein
VDSVIIEERSKRQALLHTIGFRATMGETFDAHTDRVSGERLTANWTLSINSECDLAPRKTSMELGLCLYME